MDIQEQHLSVLTISKRIKKTLRRIAVSIVKPPYVYIKNSWRGLGWLRSEIEAKKYWLSEAEIKEYRKGIKIYDVIIFFDELDLLEIRLSILDPYVDFFVIVESTESFSGNKHPEIFKINKDRYKKWSHKILYYSNTDTPKDEADARNRLSQNKNLTELDRQILTDTITSDNVGKGVVHWLKEFYQKESIKKALVGLGDDDVCYVSDLDEVWNPELVIDYSKDDIFKLRQTGYMYFLNNRTSEIDWDVWSGTIVTKYKNIKYSCLNHLRTHRKMASRYVFLRNGGWHFAFQGGYEGAKRKLVERGHFFYKPEETVPNIKERVEKNIYYRGGKVKLWVDEGNLPKHILENKEKYKNMLK